MNYSKRLLASVFSLLLLCAAYWRVCWIFSGYPPSSVDSFFYLTEFEYLNTFRKSYYGTSSLFFPLGSLLISIFKVSSTFMYKFLVTLSLLFFSAAIFNICYKKEKLNYALVGSSLPWLFNVVFFPFYSFPKLAFSFSSTIFLLSLLFRTSRNQKKLNILILCLSLLTATMHLLTVALCGMFIFFYIFFSEKFRKIRKIYICIFTITAIVLSILCIDRNIFNFTNLTYSSWTSGCKVSFCEYSQYLDYIFCTIVFFILAFLSYGTKSSILWSLLATSFLLLLPIWDEGTEMSLRISHAFVWLMILNIAIYIRKNKNCYGNVFLVSYLIFWGVAFFIEQKYQYPKKHHIQSLLPKYQGLLDKWLPQNATIYTRQGLNFAVTYYLARKSSKLKKGLVGKKDTYVLHHYSPYYKSCYPVDKTTEKIPIDVNCIKIDSRWVMKRKLAKS